MIFSDFIQDIDLESAERDLVKPGSDLERNLKIVDADMAQVKVKGDMKSWDKLKDK